MEVQQLSRRDIETAIVRRAWSHPEFRSEFLADPKATIEKYSGQKLPADIRVVALAEDEKTIHFVIPPRPGVAEQLSDEDLEKVAGGIDFITLAVGLTVGATAAVTASAIATNRAGGW